MSKTLKLKVVCLLILCSFNYYSQPYSPPVGQAGTTAMFKDSSAFINWANNCSVSRGYQNISNIQLGYATAGDSSLANGLADNSVVSLGDGGYAICTFEYPITNGDGCDFAVFENSFDDVFLELAFVEVSSDGINYFRFNSHSLTDTTTQTDSFSLTDATKLNNLAGKYRGSYGTPFDLQELANKTNLNINAISHIKIIDVIGSIQNSFASKDSFGNKINDPWPTPFPSCGFDLDAIGVIHQNKSIGIKENILDNKISIYPNPINKGNIITISSSETLSDISIFNSFGQKLVSTINNQLATDTFESGIYFIKITGITKIYNYKIVIN